jgi:hypothetical protein
MSGNRPVAEREPEAETETGTESSSDEEGQSEDRSTVVAQLELLEEENERLRQELSTVHRNRYRRAATGLAAVGALAVLGALLFPVLQTVLLALGGTGLFAALLIRYVTPERFVAASVGERVYEAVATDRPSLVEELGLQDEQVYVPLKGTTSAVRLFIPQYEEYELPEDEELETVLVIPSGERSRGVSFEPTGGGLVGELRSAVAGELASEPSTLADQLADGLVEVFELVTRATPEVNEANGRATISIAGSAYGHIDRFDHPVPSALTTGLATGLGVPVTVEVTESEDGDGEYLITCRWDPDAIDRDDDVEW